MSRTKAFAPWYHLASPGPHGQGLTECGTCVRYSCAVTGAPVAASRIHSRCPRGSKTMFGEVFGTRFQLPGLSVTYSNTYSSLHCL